MPIRDKIVEAQNEWGKKFAEDLKASLEDSLRKGGRKSPQEAALTFSNEIEFTNDGVKVSIIASGDYWINIEKGRGKNKRRPPSEALGKVWQNENAINARKVLLEIQAKYKKKTIKTGSTRPVKHTLNKPAKGLSYDKAAKTLGFIFARSIGRKGIKPKPFVDKVLRDGRLEELQKTISQIVGKEIALELNLNNKFEPITINI